MAADGGAAGDEVVVSCTDLAKTYRDFWGRRVFPALRGISLTIRRGESHALLGPNGSGKTTTLRLLLGLLRPTSGSVSLFGGNPMEAATRRRVGFLPESSSLHGFLKCTEALVLFGALHRVPRAESRRRAAELLEAVALTDAAKKRVHELSHGMRRRLALAVALVGKPDLLVLDEPTAGMDPLVRERVLALVSDHVKAGGTLLVTSHLLGDISGIATNTTLLSAGEVVRTGALDDLLERPGMRSYRVEGDGAMDDAVRRAVEEAGGRVVEAGPARASIEDLFVQTYRAGEDDADAGDAGDR